jgi:hypothetical protein
MILAIYTHKYGADVYLLRDDDEIARLRKEIAEEFWDGDNPWTGSPEQVDQYWQWTVDQYWQDKSDDEQRELRTTSLTYHYKKP